MLQRDAKQAYFQLADPDSKTYGLALTSGTTCYADLPPGNYDCFVGSPAATDIVRFVYLPRVNGSSPTLAAASIVAPTAAASAQTSGIPAAASGGGIVPATASPIRLLVKESHRLALVATNSLTMYATKVL